MNIVIAGGSGHCGKLLVDYFAARGHTIKVLSRSTAQMQGAEIVLWDGRTSGDWEDHLDGATVAINLTGRRVHCRYNAENCSEIYASRLDSTRAIGEAIARCERPPLVWLNASSATIYRHAEDPPMDEFTGEIGSGFSVDVCQRWEWQFFEAPTPHTRRVAMRSAIVFAPNDGGAWKPFEAIARIGLAGPMAGGHQWVSWVHSDDFCRAVDFLIGNETLSGPVNIAAPNPVPNSEFLRAIRRAVGQPIGLPSARWMLEIGAWLGGTETELLLKSRRVVPAILAKAGFSFTFNDWEDTARALVETEKRKVGK